MQHPTHDPSDQSSASRAERRSLLREASLVCAILLPPVSLWLVLLRIVSPAGFDRVFLAARRWAAIEDSRGEQPTPVPPPVIERFWMFCCAVVVSGGIFVALVTWLGPASSSVVVAAAASVVAATIFFAVYVVCSIVVERQDRRIATTFDAD